MSHSIDSLRGALAERYRLDRELGRGGMATVYLAHDLKHDRPVALKVLHPDLAAVLGPERFQREIRLAARLQHPHILTVHDSGESAGQLWFTMPYVEGESLRDRLNREKQLPVDDALRIAHEAALALEYAHQHGVIHRDIKPENVLLTQDGSTLVADFGIARVLGAESRLTETGMAVGTPAYMSPEQASADRAVDARTDIYSLGTVLYEMLAGEPPFTGPTAQAIIVKRFTESVPQVRAARPSVPESVSQALSRALAPIAADRFASAAEFARALATTETISAAAPPSASPTTAVPGRRRFSPALAMLGLGFLVGVGVLFAWRRSHEEVAPTGVRTVAVLPFENQGDSAQAYFAAGMTDAVRGKLASLAGLQVTARSSSVAYRHTSKTAQQIGHELGVDYLLTGTVRWARGADGGSRVQVNPELVRAGTASTAWQQPFDARVTDVFQVQAEIAGQVAQALGQVLTDTVAKRLTERPTENLAAYDAFLRGEQASNGMLASTPVTVRRAAVYYEQATALDPDFALAWARLAEAHSILYINSVPTPAEAEAARVAAERAVALAPALPSAHRALAMYYTSVQGDLPRAARAAEEGLRLAPEDPALLDRSAAIESQLGRWDSAVVHLQRVVTLDPRSVIGWRRLGIVLQSIRRYDEAESALDRALALAPADLTTRRERVKVELGRGDLAAARAVLRATPHEVDPALLVAHMGTYFDLFWALSDDQQQLLLRLSPASFDNDRASWSIVLAQTYWLRGDHARARIYADSARISFAEQIAANPADPQRHSLHGLALAYLGRKAEAIEEGKRGLALLPAPRNALIAPYLQHQLVRIYLLTGESEKALDELEPLLKVPYELSPGWLRIDPTFDPLRGNPRFAKLAQGS